MAEQPFCQDNFLLIAATQAARLLRGGMNANPQAVDEVSRHLFLFTQVEVSVSHHGLEIGQGDVLSDGEV